MCRARGLARAKSSHLSHRLSRQLHEFHPRLVVFVSHRWWDPDNGLPDNAEGEKYDIICRAVQDMIDVEGIGEWAVGWAVRRMIRGLLIWYLYRPRDPSSLILFSLASTFPLNRTFLCLVIAPDGSSIVIWCDYASIDQDDPDLQKRGIESLVSYGE